MPVSPAQVPLVGTVTVWGEEKGLVAKGVQQTFLNLRPL